MTIITAHTAPPIIITRSPGNYRPCQDHNNHWEKDGGTWDLADYEGLHPDSFLRQRDKQHQNLRYALTQAGARSPYLGPVKGLSDLVYMADGSISFLGPDNILRTIFSNFANPNRLGEEKHHMQFFGSPAFRNLKIGKAHVTAIAPFAFEGNGDFVYDPYRGCGWSGFHQNPCAENAHEGRGDIRANSWAEDFLQMPVHSLENNAPFYHIDTAIGPLPRGHMLVYTDGIKKDSLEKLKVRAFDDFDLDPEEYLIEVSAEDTNRFACNVRCIGNEILIPECSPQLQNILKSKGYKVTPIAMTAFIAGGGAIHCCSNVINEPHIEGGFHANPDRMPQPAQ